MDPRPLLDYDSGYGSLAGEVRKDDEHNSHSAHDFSQDRSLPPQGPSSTSMTDRNETIDLNQAHYDQCRSVLTTAVGKTVDLLWELQTNNAQWPIYYPMNRWPESDLQCSSRTRAPHLRPSHSGLPRTTSDEIVSDPQLTQHKVAEVLEHSMPEPKHDFSVLRLDLKIASMHEVEILQSLEKETIASLLGTKIKITLQHLFALRDRMEDESSKILITGDLNAGKSTLCNALLRRKILPEDQQPCTNLFCEVLQAKENNNIEEVHAVHKGTVYDRNDKSTFDYFSMQDLGRIVTGYGLYWQCKVYINKLQGSENTLLNNGTADITLIDAPGLNSDSVTTTAVFARQEEIDVVVFVVSAANHFTQSAADFIKQAAHEKAQMFIVVNGFDCIRDKKRCQNTILEQLALLSPQTFKEAGELVHFVSSNTIPIGSKTDFEDTELPQGKEKKRDNEQTSEFKVLEAALRKFVLEKRARTKLAPARTFILNCLKDLDILASANHEKAISDLDSVSKKIACLEAECLKKADAADDVIKQAQVEIERTTADVYQYVRSTLSDEIKMSLEANYQVEYPGLLLSFQYASAIRGCILGRISTAVQRCENYGRVNTEKGVNMLKSLGVLHLSDSYQAPQFRADMMFRRRKDAHAKTLEISISILDFFDLSELWACPEKLACSSMVLTAMGTLGSKAIGKPSWINYAFGASSMLGQQRLKWVILPGVMTAAALLLTFAVSRVPQAIPRRLANKTLSALESVDYIHSNAHRVSSEVQRVLRFPAQQLVVDMQKQLGERNQKLAKMEDAKSGTEIAMKYFGNLARQASDEESRVEALDLDWTN